MADETGRPQLHRVPRSACYVAFDILDEDVDCRRVIPAAPCSQAVGPAEVPSREKSNRAGKPAMAMSWRYPAR